MGYYTKYSVEFSPQSDAVVMHVEKFKGSDDYNENCFYEAWVDSTEDVKWYNHEDFMKTLSKKFPVTLFILEGLGEEQPDMWKKYFKDGKMQVCRAIISFEDFDGAKLK